MAAGCGVLLMNRGYDGIITNRLMRQSSFNFSGNLNRRSFSEIERDLRRLVENPKLLAAAQSFGRRYAIQHLSSTQMALRTLSIYKLALRDTSERRRQQVIMAYRLAFWGLALDIAGIFCVGKRTRRLPATRQPVYGYSSTGG